MSQPVHIPVLPESAPFTAEQRAYLNGFLAGLFSRSSAPNATAAPPPASAALRPLSVLFGSQTGTAERLAKRIAKDAGQRGFAATVHDLSRYPTDRLCTERDVLLITSTYGDGEPPDNAKAFWEFISGPSAPNLEQTRFSVCALGDSNYPRFCAFGGNVDEQLAKLGAQRIHPRVECDVDYEAPFATWLGGAMQALLGSSPTIAALLPPAAAEDPAVSSAGYDRNNPCAANLIVNRVLNGAGSAKETRHFEFALEGMRFDYEAGDALGVIPANCPELVGEILRALACSGDEMVPVTGAESAKPAIPLRTALIELNDITRISPALLKEFAERTGSERLKALTAPGVNGQLTEFLRGREVIDLLLAHPEVHFEPAAFVRLLKRLQPRLYSIASSPKLNPGHVDLCVGVVRYESLGRQRKGVCSTFLADRVASSQPVRVFPHANPNFRPPTSGDTPIIMVGPGTGIAPFRAFLQERRATGARGRNWLFFGDQRASTDYLFQEELEAYQRAGHLARLDTAFSRDQAAKVYVQDRMLAHAQELFAWLEDGAHFYVCGDATRMARDVDAALHQVIQVAGGRTEGHAAEYVSRLKAGKRYQRDVY